MRVRELLDVPALKLRLLTDVTGLDRQIKHVYTTDLPDPGRYLTPGDLVLTGMIWCREPGDADRFVRALARAGASALAAGEALGAVPSEVVDACGRHGVALLAVPAETSFASVTDEVARRLSGDRASAMTRVLGRRRRLLSAVAEGAGLDEMFRLMGREIGVDCWLLTGTGRLVGGTGPEPAAELALRLAAEYARADRLPAVVRDEESRYSLFGVGIGAGGEPRIASWFLACPGLEQDCPHEVRESVIELGADVALERARLEAGRSGERKLAEAIVALLADEGVAPAEVASLLRASGCAPDGSYVVAAFAASPAERLATGERVVAGERMAVERWRYDLAEELAQPSRALVATLGDEVIVLIPVGGELAAEAALAFTERLRAVSQVVEADRSRPRISVGVAAPATGAAALAGAMHEASSARRLASLRADGGAGMLVVTSDEVASHELLLASVPASVLRSFRDRLLGPLLWYDTQHRAELVPTLREFLACSGSWNACAAKMYVHVNTVRYRIKRIEELSGRDLSSLDDRVDFFLALRIRLAAPARSADAIQSRLRYVEGTMVRVRAATAADAMAVAAVRRASWFAAYSGIIDDAAIDRVTGARDADRIRLQFRSRPQQKMLVAVDGPDAEEVIGFASFGPEREVDGGAWPPPVSAAGAAGQCGELYALYVHPDWWSTGSGRELMIRVLDRLRRDRYQDVTLWVLEQNFRARRFYEQAGFAADGGVNILHGLGGVPEVRYRQQLALLAPLGPSRSAWPVQLRRACPCVPCLLHPCDASA